MATGSSEIWVSHEIYFNIPRKLRVLVAISGASCLVVSALYLFMLLYPQIVFTGYIHGYLSLASYELRYDTNGESVTLFNLDAVKTVALATTGYVAILAITIMFALLYLRRNILFSTSLIYGVSASLVVTSGVLRYLSQAFTIDAGILMSYANNGGVIKLRTLAGLIEYIGITAEKTFAYNLLFTNPLITLILLYASIASSTASIMWLIYIYSKQYSSKRDQKIKVKSMKSFWKTFPKIFTLVATVIGIILAYTSASVFAYNPSSIIIALQPPPTTLEAPAYACTLTRINRSALVYTDFETYPSPSWTTHGGSWNNVSGVIGAKGNVLYGENSNPSLEYAAFYHYVEPVVEYSSLWVATRTRFVGGSKPYYGVAMLSYNRTRAFAVMIHRHSASIGYLQIWSYNVTTTGWTQHASTSISNYGQTSWYTIVVYYNVSETAINITAHIYDAGGRYITNTSATITHVNVFTPAYIGVVVYDEIPGKTASAYFDEFIASIEDPRSILLTGLQAGMSAEVWDNFGNLVASGTAIGVNLTLSVVHDVVVGNGTDGRIVVKFPTGTPCVDYRVPVTDAILGGDVYRFEYLATVPVDVVLGANKTSASISTTLPSAESVRTATFLRVNTSQTLHARLLLDNLTAPATLNLDIRIEGVARSTNITIRNGVPVSTSTNIVQLNIGLNNNMTLSGYFTSISQSATLNLRLELCTAPGSMGACVYYPIVLNLSS